VPFSAPNGGFTGQTGIRVVARTAQGYADVRLRQWYPRGATRTREPRFQSKLILV